MSNGNQKKINLKGDLFLFFTPRLKIEGYNTLLQGQLRYDINNPTRISAKNISRLICEFETGFVVKTSGRTDVMFTISNRTKSFKYEGVAARSHWWGRLYFIFNPEI